MENFNSNISIRINQNVYIKDPESSDLGKKIIRFSIDLIEEIGYEDFTFKKLAANIQSTEASIYRYFENKHKLLTYLTLWYWGWLEYRLILKLVNIEDPMEQLKRAIELVTEEITEDKSFSQINEVKLQQVIITDSTKIIFGKQVDEDNKLGYFSSFKSLVERISQIVLKINNEYSYPHMLVSTIIEGAQHQRYFAEHLPRLTDKNETDDTVTTFYLQLAQRELGIIN